MIYKIIYESIITKNWILTVCLVKETFSNNVIKRTKITSVFPIKAHHVMFYFLHLQNKDNISFCHIPHCSPTHGALIFHKPALLKRHISSISSTGCLHEPSLLPFGSAWKGSLTSREKMCMMYTHMHIYRHTRMATHQKYTHSTFSTSLITTGEKKNWPNVVGLVAKVIAEGVPLERQLHQSQSLKLVQLSLRSYLQYTEE